MALAPFPEYDNASEVQKAIMCDGCGGNGKVWVQGLILPIPQWQLKEACMRHDFRYCLGGTEADRCYADRMFLADMHQKIRDELEWYKRPFAYVLARIYYWAVAENGAQFFRYGPRVTAAEWMDRWNAAHPAH